MATIKPLYKYPQHPMDANTSLAFIKMASMEASANEAQVKELHDELMAEWGSYPIMYTRLEAVGVKATFPLLVFCSTMIRTPGEAVMYAHAIACMAKDKSKAVTITDFAHKFAHGFPDLGGMSDAWQAQKDGGANMLDRPDLHPWVWND